MYSPPPPLTSTSIPLCPQLYELYFRVRCRLMSYHLVYILSRLRYLIITEPSSSIYFELAIRHIFSRFSRNFLVKSDVSGSGETTFATATAAATTATTDDFLRAVVVFFGLRLRHYSRAWLSSSLRWVQLFRKWRREGQGPRHCGTKPVFVTSGLARYLDKWRLVSEKYLEFFFGFKIST